MTAPPTSMPTGLPSGSLLGPYRIELRIGAGSLGAVYSATDDRGRRLAMKVFELTGGLPQIRRDTLSRETTIYRELAHPDIVAMLDAGVVGDMAYIAMELVIGRTLSAHTRPGHLLPIASVLRIGSRVAGALAHAHRHGIVHRDVKPDNILIDWPGTTVKLADFGIASLGDSFRTQTGVVLGTPYYMSPEQLCGGIIDARTDLYALGAVLFEALSGQRPHNATSLGALLRQVASHDAPGLGELRPAIPAPVSSLVGALLSRQPGRRPGVADSVCDDLARLASNFAGPDEGPKSRR